MSLLIATIVVSLTLQHALSSAIQWPTHSWRPVHEGNVIIYVLSYSEATEAAARAKFSGQPWYHIQIPTTDYFENLVFIDLVPTLSVNHSWATRDYVGFVSHKGFDKFSWANLSESAGPVMSSIQNGTCKADVIAWHAEAKRLPYGGLSSLSQASFPIVWDSSVKALDSRLVLPFRTFFSNYWLARPGLVLQYSSWLRLAVLRLVKDPHFFHPVSYRDVTPEMKQAGMDFYPLAPFLLERMPGAYFQNVVGGLDIMYVTVASTCMEVKVLGRWFCLRFPLPEGKRSSQWSALTHIAKDTWRALTGERNVCHEL